MNKNRTDQQGGPNRTSEMEQAEGSRDNADASSSERGTGSADERNSESPGSRMRGKSGGISNRDLEREQSEQEQLPERGRTQSEG